MPRRRLDVELVRRRLATSQEQAKDLIADNRVTVGGSIAAKSSRQVASGESVEVLNPPERFVGRGAYKLEGALDGFAIDVAGLRAVDAGASTGGFTDCLLQRGCREVAAVDVGYGQLHERLRQDWRVHSFERTNIRGLDPEVIGGVGDVVVADLSFISLRRVLPDLLRLLRPGGQMVTLVKPQFEAEKAEADRGRGIIRDPLIWRRVLEEVFGAVVAQNAAIMGVMKSPITGTDGNVEFLLHATSETPGRGIDELAPMLDSVIELAKVKA